MLSSRVFGEDEEGNSWNKLERLDALLPAADGDVPSKMVDDPVFLSFFGLSLKDIEHRELSRVGIFETRYDAEEDEDEYEDSPSPVTGLSAYAGRMTLGTPLDDDVAIKIEEEDVSFSPGAPSEYESFDSLSPISNVLSPGTGFTTEEEDEMIAPVDDLEELDDQVWNLDPECSVGSAELMGDKDEPMKEKIGGEGDVSFPTTQTYVPICREPFTPCMKEQELARFEPLEATDQEGVELDAIIDTETTTEAPLTF
ncbi:hypothetical protein BT69DRAFT_1284348 [Atractiella rhizophila]|nr:hypothetical protein BT69DRAFT_1284348 [Atractiella rhizophila]